ncbi:cell division protein FtsQ/DivIB [Planomonospora parontospora]|uniref:cell division protein FtsQ/DivIB n=1 Tax=Planomonospora parontospora TaxID=58119 RepID=UPI001E2D3C9A|nr:FtsQ-type POTRA domain-containing protein [Planomonospora parontospora]
MPGLRSARSVAANRAWRTAFLVLLTAGVVGSAVWLVFLSPVLGVRDIRVTGNFDVSAAQIRQTAGVVDGTPLATVDAAAVEGRIRGIRRIESAEVSRNWPGTLVIEVVEREPVAAVQVGDKSALMDRHGVVVEVRETAPPALPVLRLDRPGPGDPATAAALAVIDALPEELAPRVAEVHAPSAETVTLRLKDGRTVMWGGRDRPADKARILVTLLQRPADTYDVSSPDVVTLD